MPRCKILIEDWIKCDACELVSTRVPMLNFNYSSMKYIGMPIAYIGSAHTMCLRFSTTSAEHSNVQANCPKSFITIINRW